MNEKRNFFPWIRNSKNDELLACDCAVCDFTTFFWLHFNKPYQMSVPKTVAELLGAPYLRKFGNPSISKIWVVT